jgi:hypothetical protein
VYTVCMLEQIIVIVVSLTIVVSNVNVRHPSISDVQQALLPSPASCDIQHLQRTLDVDRASIFKEYM